MKVALIVMTKILLADMSKDRFEMLFQIRDEKP